MAAANSLIGDPPESYYEDATVPLAGVPFPSVGAGDNVPRIVAALLVFAVTIIILFRYAGLQAMVAVGGK